MTLLTKEVEVKWRPETKEWYILKGYNYTKYNAIFKVKVEDIHNGSSASVKIKCEYCNSSLDVTYKNLITSRKNSIIKKDACINCHQEKVKEEADLLQSQGRLNKSHRYYMKFKENREKELVNYIEENKTLDLFIKKNKSLYTSLLNNESRNLYEIVTELGYKWSDICSTMPNNYFKNKENLTSSIQEFIDSKGYFPSITEMHKDLKIHASAVAHHGGMYEIKRLFNYTDNYIDDRGFFNLSKVEYIVAQFLIKNNIHYKREQLPFHNEKLRSDFTITTISEEVFHVEVWGYKENIKDKISTEYNNKRKLKESLYKKHGINLITIEYAELNDLRYSEKQQYLIDKFNFLKDIELVKYENASYMHPKTLSDEEIYNTILKFSDDIGFLPNQDILIEQGMNSLLVEIRKRYDSYNDFALHFGMQEKYISWNEKTIHNTLLEIYKLNLPVNKKSIDELGYSGMFNFLQREYKTSSLVKHRLSFFDSIKDIKTIHLDDLQFLCESSRNINNTNSLLTEDDVLLAMNIINSISNKDVLLKIKEFNNKLDYQSLSENEKSRIEYMEYFKSMNLNGVDLFPINFKSISKYTPKSFMKVFNLNWIEFMSYVGLKEEFESTLISAFKSRYDTIDCGRVDYFLREIKLNYGYVTAELKESLLSSIGKKRVVKLNEITLMENFNNIKIICNGIPLYTEFMNNTKYSIGGYARFFNLKGSGEVYNKIVRMYSTDEEFEDYNVRQKIHRSESSKTTHSYPINK